MGDCYDDPNDREIDILYETDCVQCGAIANIARPVNGCQVICRKCRCLGHIHGSQKSGHFVRWGNKEPTT